ncbi:hypothetical protein FOA52_016087 [Chlamydomonas sp. UWO 241]|nr:hypothetical protein FOA52_016087 [Chlamydomonas sp. UWO 241]
MVATRRTRAVDGAEAERDASAQLTGATREDVGAPAVKEEQPVTDPAAERAAARKKKLASLKTRTYSTVVLILLYGGVVWSGHVPVTCLVMLLQVMIIKEVFRLGRMDLEDHRLPGFRAQQWYFFAVAAFYLYIRIIKPNILVQITRNETSARLLTWLLHRHLLISYFAYCAGIIAFVLSLKRGLMLYQFAQYAWTHMIILVVIVPTSFFVSSTFQGIIWYLMPSMLIIVNDICAYLFGICFGKTPLIRLSPKKTWEGFLGGFFSAAVVAFYGSRFLAGFAWMACPREDLSLGPLSCVPSPVFQDRSFTLQELAEEMPGPLEEMLQVSRWLLPSAAVGVMDSWSWTLLPLQLHAVPMSIFASLICPFGGFFASGLKRAMRLKDFGDTIPGHGGIMDRVDCQVLMAIFSSLYYWSYIQPAAPPTVGMLLEEVLSMQREQQLEVIQKLGTMVGAVSGARA